MGKACEGGGRELRREISLPMVEASSDRRKTTTLVRPVTWAASEATFDLSEGERGAMQASDFDWLSSGGAGQMFAGPRLEEE